MAKSAAAPVLLFAIVSTLPMIFFSQLTVQQRPKVVVRMTFDQEDTLSASTQTKTTSSSKLCSDCDDFPPNFPPPDTDTTSFFCVDQNGCCMFTTVQSAIDAVDDHSQKRNIIWINNGIYYEKVVVPKTKPNIIFQGQGMQSTAIVWNDTAATVKGTERSSSVTVKAANFMAKNISFKNSAMPKPGSKGAQAVAMSVEGDRAAFWGCGFFGLQDTLLDKKGRHYYRDCYIQGTTDFIFGDATSFFENCELRSVAAAGSKSVNGAVTAQGRAATKGTSGFAFVNCTIGGTGLIWLGRAWRPDARVVFAHTFMSDIIYPDGWTYMADPPDCQSVFFGEYKNTGPGADMSKRVDFAKQLDDAQAAPFLSVSFIDADKWLQPFYEQDPL